MDYNYLENSRDKYISTSSYGSARVKCSEIDDKGANYICGYLSLLDKDNDPDWSPVNDKVAGNVIVYDFKE